MRIQSFLRPAVFFCLVLPAAVFAQAQVSIVGTPHDLATGLYVNGTSGHQVSIYELPADSPNSTPDCFTGLTGTLLKIIKTPAVPASPAGVTPVVAAAQAVTEPVYTLPSGSSPFLLSLDLPLAAKTMLCVEDLGTSTTPNTPPLWSPPATVAAAPPTPTPPQLMAGVKGGASTISVQGRANDMLTIYSFDPGVTVSQCNVDPAHPDTSVNNRTPLLMVTATTPTQQYSTSFPLTVSTTTAITLSQPLVAGATLCIAETQAGYAASWSTPLTVSDPNDYGRYRTYFTIGIQASNQLSSSAASSSTAGQYLEAGFINSWLQAKDFKDRGSNKGHRGLPGLTTNIDVRLNPIPVAATQTVTTLPTSTPSVTTAITPSVLSSQQSVRFVTSGYMPWKTTNWNNHSDFFTLAPLVRAGFGTLLSPGTNSAASTGAGTPSTITSTSYSSAYYFWGLGTRFAWDRYSSDPDKTPRTIAQFLAVVGDYSNLPSFVCNPISAAQYNTLFPSSTTAVTACNQGQYAPVLTTSTSTSSAGATTTTSTAASNTFIYSRTIRPRVDIEGFAKLPNYPFVIGIDANLQQYGLFNRGNLDYLNKPGNDIRLFIGVSVDFASIVSQLQGGK
jgi:hypothetical protein